MAKKSAGLLMYRLLDGELQVLLGHPGGPFWRNRDEGAWSIPKGEILESEDPLEAAKREFREETGIHPDGPFIELSPIRQRGGKTVRAWAFEGDCDPSAIESEAFEMEWPPNSGRMQEFPEIDEARFFELDEAKRKINPAQVALLEELASRLDSG